MRKRTIDKHIWFNRAEAQELQKKARKACLSEAGLIRFLIKGYQPKEKPDDRFYDVMFELNAIGNNLNQLTAKAHSLNFIDTLKLEEETKKWHNLQNKVEREFLSPKKDGTKWQ